jgi:pyruvate dehydrogenase E2 component (dihydrolipoamide acetyltransferase)
MTIEIKLPHLGENLQGGEVAAVKVAVGDQVTAGQPLLEVEAEKSTMEVPAPSGGRVVQVLIKTGDQVKTDQVLFVVDAGAALPSKDGGRGTKGDETKRSPSVPASLASSPMPPPRSSSLPSIIPAGPATRLLARKLGVDLAKVPGSQRHGRVTQDDVWAYVNQSKSTKESPMTGGARVPAPPMPDFEKWGAVERQPLESIRRATAQQMSLAWSVIPHVTQHDLADITDLEAFRREQEVKAKASQAVKLTVTAFALKAAAIALKAMPSFNASLDTDQGQLILKKYYHLGVAVDTERGLLVPVIRDVDKKSVTELAQELTEIAQRARQKKITAEEMRGGTFTITNLGGIGGTGFTPIINYPEAAILGLSRGRVQPVFSDGQVVPRLLLPLSLSYDHRIIDGAAAARFTRRIADMLEKPMMMLLDA